MTISRGAKALIVVALAGSAVAAFMWWQHATRQAPPAEPVAAAAPMPTPSEPVAAAPLPASAPAVQHEIETPPAAQPPLAAPHVAQALEELLGRKAVLTFLQTENFLQRFVATVDNLGRSHAPPIVWPVNPSAGRFMVDKQGNDEVISADNALRYTPFVLMVESMDVGRATDLYLRLYPLLQQTYEELGFPGRYFNDRLIEVIDQLLATPEAGYPVRLELTEVKGPLAPQRPWVRYQFADPALESLAAGQKILLRMGPVNERRLKAKLAAFRAELAKREKAR